VQGWGGERRGRRPQGVEREKNERGENGIRYSREEKRKETGLGLAVLGRSACAL
jgi:hypothetical protein